MTANIIRNRLNAFLVLLILGVGFITAYPASAAENQPQKIDRSRHDRRHEQVGTWNCEGVTTAPYGTERPYYGVLNNEWSPDHSLLIVHFEEKHPVTETPLIEVQQWGYDEQTNTHSRTLRTNDGSHGAVRSHGWQKDILPWNGTFSIGDTDYNYEETIDRLSAKRYRWRGLITHDTTIILSYDMTCTRQ